MRSPTMIMRDVSDKRRVSAPKPRRAPARAAVKGRRGARYIPYLLVAGSAVYGQIMAGYHRLHPAHMIDAIPIYIVAFAIEGMAVWMAWLAKERGERGENVKPFFVISTVCSVVAVGVNVLGHWGDPWQVVIFGVLSAAGYVIWCFDLSALLDDTWDPDGSIRKRVPGMRILLKLTGDDAGLATQARRIALLYAEAYRDRPGLGPAEAIEMARAERNEQQRRTMLEAAVRQLFTDLGLCQTDIDLAMLAHGPDEIVEALSQIVDNPALAEALASRIHPARLAGIKPGKGVGGGLRLETPRRGDKLSDRLLDKFSGKAPASDKAPAEALAEAPAEKPVAAAKAPAAPRVAAPKVAAPRPVAAKATTGELLADPYVVYFDQLAAVAWFIPLWRTRHKKVSDGEVLDAQRAAHEAGRLQIPMTSKPYCNKFAWMIEALSERAAAIPEGHWVRPNGPLCDVDRETLGQHREALGPALVGATD